MTEDHGVKIKSLLVQVASKDEEAFKELVEVCRGPLSRYLRSLNFYLDEFGIDFVVIETMQRVWERAHQFNDGSAKWWIWTIAKHIAHDHSKLLHRWDKIIQEYLEHELIERAVFRAPEKKIIDHQEEQARIEEYREIFPVYQSRIEAFPDNLTRKELEFLNWKTDPIKHKNSNIAEKMDVSRARISALERQVKHKATEHFPELAWEDFQEVVRHYRHTGNMPYV